MSQTEKAALFASLHVKGTPLVLYNAWDAGSAKVILDAGAKVIATSSWAVAEAQGYRDGESIPLDLVQQIIGRITATVDAPVTVDFEGGYSDDDARLADNISRLLDLGVIGINFEDRLVKGSGLYDISQQAGRISAIRKAADKKGVALFINARTDTFFQGGEAAQFLESAIVRAEAYADAGASGFFVPGLTDDSLIERLAEGITLPVNVMVMGGLSPADRLAKLGVARISHGAGPYLSAREAIKTGAQSAYA